MSMEDGLLISPALVMVLSVLISQSFGSEYKVGDSIWSIPPTNDFYTNWSSSHSFHTGDTLFFDFDSGLYNVIQVSRRDYETCTADHPFKAFMDGPASVLLMEQGVFYFICSVADYCALGQKLSAIVHDDSPNSAPTLSPSPSSSLQHLPLRWEKPPPPPPNGMDWSSISLVGAKSAGECDNGESLWACFAALCLAMSFCLGVFCFG